nr:hypothetical protein [Bradyrhizobium sp.]
MGLVSVMSFSPMRWSDFGIGNAGEIALGVAIPDVALAFGRLFPADSAIDGLVRVNQLGAGIWEVGHDWLALWCLALGYFALAVISAFAVRRRQGHAQP